MMFRGILLILNRRSVQKFLVMTIGILLYNMFLVVPVLAAKNEAISGENLLLAKKFETSQEYPSPRRKGKAEKQQMANLEEASRKLMKLEKRISELEVLEPILKAEVLSVTKMAANASTLKERKLATARIREAEDKAIAVIKELRALRKQHVASEAQVALAKESKGMKVKLSELDSIHSKFVDYDLNKTEKRIDKDESQVIVRRDKKRRIPKVKRRKAKRVDEVAFAGKKIDIKPMPTVLEKSDFKDVIGKPKSDYEKALEKQFTAFITLLDAFTAEDISEKDEEKALEQYEETRKEVMKSLEEAANQP